MSKNLKEYFPSIRTRKEILREIDASPHLASVFYSWDTGWQSYFLDVCTGKRGVRILYDTFFKEIMDPEIHPERLNDILSVLLGMEVRILRVLPLESPRIADESSLLTMDIVVELEDRSIANVEIQKIGYKFPGERGACYSADLLLRQYRNVRKTKGKKFSYNDVKPVYTVVFFEQSPAVFHRFPDDWIHSFSMKSDTGLELNLLQKYYFLPIDIFKKNQHNKPIKSKAEAWLTFLNAEDPETIIRLLEDYPEYAELYRDIYEICRNTENVMEKFSEELKIMDQNTVQLMIDEMQDQLDEQKAEIEGQKAVIADKDAAIADKDAAIADKDAAIANKDAVIADKDAALADKDIALARKDEELEAMRKRIARLEQTLSKA